MVVFFVVLCELLFAILKSSGLCNEMIWCFSECWINEMVPVMLFNRKKRVEWMISLR